MAAYTTALFRVMIAFLFGFHPNAVLAQSENCITVETTSDKCRSADYITVDGQRVNKGEVKTIQLTSQLTEINWFCGSSKERTAWGEPANQLDISYQNDGTIQWNIKRCSACVSVDSTSDKCRSADYITVAGQRVDKGASNKIIKLPGLQKETKWYCGSAEERTAWDKPANELRVNYESDGTIHWDIYKCGASSVQISALAALITICLIIFGIN